MRPDPTAGAHDAFLHAASRLEGDTPSPFPTPPGAFGASILAPAVLDHWLPPRFWNSGYTALLTAFIPFHLHDISG